jgi:HEPN domain-containing protein/predicted nucleotidyltransferase
VLELAPTDLPDEWRQLIVRRLSPFEPIQILVFGSRARGDGSEDSDVDLLVVVASSDGGDTSVEIMRALGDAPFANDVVVATPEVLARRGDAIGTVYRRALTEGVVIYGMDDRDEKTWLRYAEEDLATAEKMAGKAGFAPRWGCFLAQQAAEKALKAVLVYEGTDFPPTHDLSKLRDLAAARPISELAVGLRDLSQWATRGRYPGDWPEASQDDARRAADQARAVLDAAGRAIA